MIEIHPTSNGGYSIKFDRGFGSRPPEYKVSNFQELVLALEHYNRPNGYNELHINGDLPKCPLCRIQKAEENVYKEKPMTFKGVQKFAESLGLIFEKNTMYEDGKIVQRYEICDNENGVSAGVATLTEAVEEIESWR